MTQLEREDMIKYQKAREDMLMFGTSLEVSLAASNALDKINLLENQAVLDYDTAMKLRKLVNTNQMENIDLANKILNAKENVAL